MATINELSLLSKIRAQPERARPSLLAPILTPPRGDEVRERDVFNPSKMSDEELSNELSKIGTFGSKATNKLAGGVLGSVTQGVLGVGVPGIGTIAGGVVSGLSELGSIDVENEAIARGLVSNIRGNLVTPEGVNIGIAPSSNLGFTGSLFDKIRQLFGAESKAGPDLSTSAKRSEAARLSGEAARRAKTSTSSSGSDSSTGGSLGGTGNRGTGAASGV